MSEEIFENIRIPFIIQKYEDKAMVIPKELYMNYDNGKMYIKSIDGSTEIEVGRKTIENTIKIEIDKLIGKSTSNGNTLRKLQDLLAPLKQWKEQMSSINYLSVGTIAEILDVFQDMEETAPTLFAQLQNKVNKVQGLELSDNDFTNTLFDKLNGIEKEANLYEHPETKACSYVAPISLVNGRTGDVVITAADLGLENVEPGAKKYIHPLDKQCTAVSIDNVKANYGSSKTGIVSFSKTDFELDKVTNNPLITEAEIAASLDGVLPAGRYCTPHTLNLYLNRLKTLGKFDETAYKYVPKTVTLTINTTPVDAIAKVYYNGQWNTGKVHNIPSKSGYMVLVEKAGWTRYEKYHQITTDTNVTLNVTLQQIMFDYNFTLTNVVVNVPYTLTIKDASDVVVDTKTLLNTQQGNVSTTVIGKLKPGVYTYIVTGTNRGQATVNHPGTFTITNTAVHIEGFTFSTVNLENRFFKNNIQLDTFTQDGDGWRILVYHPGDSLVSAGWRHLPTAATYEMRSALINKAGYKYAFIPKSYIYNNNGNMLVTNITNALNDPNTIIRDINTADSNCLIVNSTVQINQIDIPEDPCSILTHGNTTSFGIYNNGICSNAVLSTITDKELYTLLGISYQTASSSQSRWVFNGDGKVRAYKAILDGRIIYMNSSISLTNISYKYLQDIGLTNANGKTITVGGKQFRVKMYTGSDGNWNSGGDISKMLPVLSQLPDNVFSAQRMYGAMRDLHTVGSVVTCRDTPNNVDLCVQRGGLHGLYALPLETTMNPDIYYRSLADIYSESKVASFWCYFEEV